MRPDLFVHALNMIDNGAAAEECSEALNDVFKAVNQTGKPGSITLKLDIKPHGDGRYHILHKISTKEPEKPVYATLVFASEDGNIHKRDPNQGELPLVDATREAPAKIVDARG